MIPAEPDVPASQRAHGIVHLRYEDVSQDGRVVVTALPQALGEAVWRPLLSRSPIASGLRDAGIVPILSRLHVVGGDGPVSVRAELAVDGCYDTAHTLGANGEVDRILVRMWTRITGPRGRTHGPPPAGAGEPTSIGAVYAEHVLTRPFGPPEQRKVLRLDLPGILAVPEHRVAFRAPEDLGLLPDGATALDATPVDDAVGWVFGLDDTDSNQHVNSLVYPRLFREAGLRRLLAHGVEGRLLARGFEIAYRKPCFSGDRVRTVGRAFLVAKGTARTERMPDVTHGFAARLVPERSPSPSEDGGAGAGAKAYCFARVVFSD